jgi:hypothetical protein
VKGHLNRDYAGEAALIAVAGAWATSDAPAAMRWLTALPAGKKREVAVWAGFRVWFQHSPKDAERWLRSASPAPAVDPAVRFMVEQTQDKRPAASRKWAARIARKP